MFGEIKIWVIARLDDGGKVAVELRGAMKYADDGRTVTESLEVPADEHEVAEIKGALERLIERYGAKLQKQATVSAANALTVAARLGEI